MQIRPHGLLAVVAALLGIATSDAADPALYGSAYNGATGPATLYSINPNSGAATSIGPIGFKAVGGIDFDPLTGILYGTGLRPSGAASVLLTIDPMTGLGTEVGSLGLGSDFPQDISFRSDGTLYAYLAGDIYTINTSSGIATFVGNSGAFSGGNALGFSPSDILYTVNQSTIRTVNQSDGSATFVSNMNYAPLTDNPRANGMDFDSSTGTLWASVTTGMNSGINYLTTINPTNGNVTVIGQTVPYLDALTVAAAVPETATWAAGVLCAIALGFLGRLRRSS